MQQKRKEPTVLVVEDDVDIREVLKEVLIEETTYRPLVAADCAEAITIMRGEEHKPVCCIMDYHLPDCKGPQCLQDLHNLGVEGMEYSVPIILCSANPPRKIDLPGWITVVEKPFDLDLMLTLINNRARKKEVRDSLGFAL